MLDQLLQLTHPAAVFALVAWAELRILPVARKILARSEEAADSGRKICEHLGLTALTDAQGDEIASREAPTVNPEAVKEGARVALRVLESLKDATPKGS